MVFGARVVGTGGLQAGKCACGGFGKAGGGGLGQQVCVLGDSLVRETVGRVVVGKGPGPWYHGRNYKQASYWPTIQAIGDKGKEAPAAGL
jgi:hypothetical protein